MLGGLILIPIPRFLVLGFPRCFPGVSMDFLIEEPWLVGVLGPAGDYLIVDRAPAETSSAERLRVP